MNRIRMAALMIGALALSSNPALAGNAASNNNDLKGLKFRNVSIQTVGLENFSINDMMKNELTNRGAVEDPTALPLTGTGTFVKTSNGGTVKFNIDSSIGTTNVDYDLTTNESKNAVMQNAAAGMSKKIANQLGEQLAKRNGGANSGPRLGASSKPQQ